MFTAADIASLKAALATGASQVRFADGRSVTYRTTAEIREVIGMAERELAAAAAPVSRTFVAEF